MRPQVKTWIDSIFEILLNKKLWDTLFSPDIYISTYIYLLNISWNLCYVKYEQSLKHPMNFGKEKNFGINPISCWSGKDTNK